MRRFVWGACFVLGVAGVAAAAAAPIVRYVDFEAPVTPATAVRILDAIDEAESRSEALVLIRLDTPGGMVETTQDIVKRMLASKVPVAVWVGPSGAHAASAGFYILLAADVAAMAPGTRTGAATAVQAFGENKEGDVLLKKANEDVAALVRSICEHRGRDADVAERAVTSSEAFTDAAALDAGLVDLVARDREALLEALDGRTVRRFDGSTTVLATRGATVVEGAYGIRQHVMEFLATPIVAFLLLLLGAAGIYIELTHPGLVFPGVVGALALILFAFAAQALPVSAVGILLLLLGLVMFVLEIKVTSYGMLGVGGTVCLVLGSMMLFQGPIPELRLPLAVVLPGSLTLAALCAVAVRLAVLAQRAPVATGRDGMKGEPGTVLETLSPRGRIFVHGEVWNAVAASGTIPAGARVRIVSVRDLELTVEPLPSEAGRPAEERGHVRP